MDEETLISLVRQYPELYDYGDPKYHDDHRRMNIWEEISGIVNETPADCKEKWKKIRENFRKANNLRKSKRGQAAKNFKAIRYAKELSFLMPYIQNERNQSLTNSDPLMSDEDEESSRISREQVRLSYPPFTPESPAVSIASSVASKGKTNIIMGEPPTCTHTLFQNYLQNKYAYENAHQQEPDTLVDFFKNLGQTVKQFPFDLQVRVKSAVFNIVNQAEAELVQGIDPVQKMLQNT